jgi:ferrous iron transport protein B
MSTEFLTYAIVGNSNSGKSTIFNALTGLRQKVANYPGVTVERKEGWWINQHGKKIKLIDLPGAYSLSARSPDEAVLRDVLLGRLPSLPRPDRVLFVIDGSNLQRQMYLLNQVLELEIPILLAINMMDVVQERGMKINIEKLEECLGISTVCLSAAKGKGLIELKIALSRESIPLPITSQILPDQLTGVLLGRREELSALGLLSSKASLLESIYLLSEHDPLHSGILPVQQQALIHARKELNGVDPQWENDLIEYRYKKIDSICQQVLSQNEDRSLCLTDQLDQFLLHPFCGLLTLITVLLGLFFSMFYLASYPSEWINLGIDFLTNYMTHLMPEGELRDLLTEGIIQGTGGILVFLPQIMILFFFLGLIEDSGYMARLAYLMDRLMHKVGLNGKAFLPILSSHACAVPGVMSTRVIEHPKDRLITILVAPLASCSARLPIYSLLISVIFPDKEQNLLRAFLMLSLYFIGIGGAFLFAFIFNHLLLRTTQSNLLLELPAYRWPSIRSNLMMVLSRAKAFVIRAGTVILALSILIWAASTYPKSAATATPAEALENSFAGKIGHWIEPVIKPIGLDWKMGIGLLTSFAAREVFVNTMAIIYAVECDEKTLDRSLQEKVKTERGPTGQQVYTTPVCLSLLVFYVFAMQCVSTLVVVSKETNSWKWPLIQLVTYSTFAYICSLVVFQVSSLFLS